jgi:SAM-dependent methyltransferase
MAERVDFSANAPRYDRRHGAVLANREVDALITACGLDSSSRVLDVGAGTGRVATALASRGCKVVALEPSAAMLTKLREKPFGDAVNAVSGEGGRLPFARRRFDAVVIARLLYLTPDWTSVLHQACDVLRPGGHLLHEWSNGSPDESWVRIRVHLRTLLSDAGATSGFHPGVRTETEVDEFLATIGFDRANRISFGPGPALTLSEFLNRIESREVSYLWDAPAEVQARVVPVLRAWAAATFELNQPVPMPREICWAIYRLRTT